MRIWSNAFTIAVILVAGLALAVAAGKQSFYGAGPLEEARVIEVRRGASLAAIAEDFEKAGAISSAFLFSTSARVMGVAGSLKAGEYQIDAGESMASILDKVTEGRVLPHLFTAPEGLTSAEIVALLHDMQVLEGEVAEIPAEGSLAPDTYQVHRGETRQAVVDRMQEAQETILAELWSARAEGLPISTPEEALILASIVEKETGVASERPQVASVFVNRLRKGMRLQTDPTVIYGITNGAGPLGRELTRKDVQTPSEYNTYTIDGLPPGPIANPGRASIEATLNPAETDFLYFVAEGNGGHVFAKTLNEHNRNVARWRKIRKQQTGG